VTAVNGAEYRQRPIPDVVREFGLVQERGVLVVDDNLIGTRPEHLARAKDLFRALIEADVRKQWIAQVTINFSDDEELMALATQAGCRGVFIGFESPSPEGLREVGKRFNLRGGRDFRASVRRIQRHGILVVGSFVMGLDVDGPGIGTLIARTAERYGLDDLNALFLTPLPGTRLWDQMETEGRILLHDFPADWSRYTLSFPVVRYAQLSTDEIVSEMRACSEHFYSWPRITWRVMGETWGHRQPVRSLVTNLAFRRNARLSSQAQALFLEATDPSTPG
jgi:radical SAM superfamily enzyme YgiQ (UPF0313 family)